MREDTPCTEERLVREFRALGIQEGETLLVQSSLRSLGPVQGGARTVVDALRTVLGAGGTLVAYTATPENSLTSRAHLAAVRDLDAAARTQFVRDMPGFDPASTPSSPTVGRLAEAIRTTEGARRSAHPQTSFAALGPKAGQITESHPPDCHLGDRSPLGRLYELDARGLLIGIPNWLFTPYHLADCRVPGAPTKRYDCAVLDQEGRRSWQSFEDVDLDDVHLPELGDAVQREVKLIEGWVGEAECWLIPLVPAVNAATRWLTDRPAAVHDFMRDMSRE